MHCGGLAAGQAACRLQRIMQLTLLHPSSVARQQAGCKGVLGSVMKQGAVLVMPPCISCWAPKLLRLRNTATTSACQAWVGLTMRFWARSVASSTTSTSLRFRCLMGLTPVVMLPFGSPVTTCAATASVSRAATSIYLSHEGDTVLASLASSIQDQDIAGAFFSCLHLQVSYQSKGGNMIPAQRPACVRWPEAADS